MLPPRLFKISHFQSENYFGQILEIPELIKIVIGFNFFPKFKGRTGVKMLLIKKLRKVYFLCYLFLNFFSFSGKSTRLFNKK